MLRRPGEQLSAVPQQTFAYTGADIRESTQQGSVLFRSRQVYPFGM